jgi:HD-like signal output (HDOD) protein
MRQLPALPRTYARLRETMAKGDATVQEVSAVISSDSAIAAKVLQIVNSAFFRLAKRVTKIEQAVTYLGFIAIRNLTMSVEVFSQWSRSGAPAGFDAERLQQQAQQVAATARALAPDSVSRDDAMLAGLLHNIGYCVLVDQCPAEIERAAKFAREKGIPMHQAERDVIGATHAEVGAYLLGIWGLPYQIIEAVAFQHAPAQVGQSELDLLAVLAIAETLALADAPNAFGVSEAVEGAIDECYLRALHAPYDWSEAQRRATNALRELSL